MTAPNTLRRYYVTALVQPEGHPADADWVLTDRIVEAATSMAAYDKVTADLTADDANADAVVLRVNAMSAADWRKVAAALQDALSGGYHVTYRRDSGLVVDAIITPGHGEGTAPANDATSGTAPNESACN